MYPIIEEKRCESTVISPLRRRVQVTDIFRNAKKRGENGHRHYAGLKRVSGDRSMDTLLQSIKSNIKEGTTVISYCWKAYDCLEDEGFFHLSVNPSMFFKAPETAAHSNSIEGSWSAIKKSVLGTRRCENQFDSCGILVEKDEATQQSE
ncbi:DDE_Tnp_IS1595 domain-containing protein [Trichonephila clavipes]|nr:DDE_Tnp_IS1595 domain-containing protein [Trichonephila clavipes]